MAITVDGQTIESEDSVDWIHYVDLSRLNKYE